MLYTVDNGPKFNFFTCFRYRLPHFIPYSRQVVEGIERQIERVEALPELVPVHAE